MRHHIVGRAAISLVVASVVCLSQVVGASAKGGKQPPPGGNQPPPTSNCFGHIYNCPGPYQYQCVELTLGNGPSVFTNSDATEDYYEDFTVVTSAGLHLHLWRCYGD